MTVDGDVLALSISRTREPLKSSFEPRQLPSPFKGVRPLNQPPPEAASPPQQQTTTAPSPPPAPLPTAAAARPKR
jgi:hypothetical protein